MTYVSLLALLRRVMSCVLGKEEGGEGGHNSLTAASQVDPRQQSASAFEVDWGGSLWQLSPC